MHLMLFVLFCVWGGFLFYFTYTQQQCASSSPAIYRLSLLLLLVFFVLLGLAVLLFTCVCIDCCVSGRMRLVLLLSDEPARSATPLEGYVGNQFFVGTTQDKPARLAPEGSALDRTTTLFTKGQHHHIEGGGRLLPEQSV